MCKKSTSNIIDLKDYHPKISEAQLKNSIQDYLQILENQGVLYWDRLNSGELLVLNKDESKRLVKLCRKGTADLFFITHDCIMVFIETKCKNKKQSDDQKEFQVKVERFGAAYWLVKSFEQFENLISEYLD